MCAEQPPNNLPPHLLTAALDPTLADAAAPLMLLPDFAPVVVCCWYNVQIPSVMLQLGTWLIVKKYEAEQVSVASTQGPLVWATGNAPVLGHR